MNSNNDLQSCIFGKLLSKRRNTFRFKYLKTKHSWHLVDPSP